MKKLPFKTIGFFACLSILAAFLAGCIPSLHPLYEDSDLVYKPALEGKWINQDSTYIWSFSRKTEITEVIGTAGKSSQTTARDYYLLAIQNREEGKVIDNLVAKLGKINNKYCLDLAPDLEALNLSKEGISQFNLIAGHSFYPLDWEEGSQFKTYSLNMDTLDKGIKEKKYNIKLEEFDKRSVMVSPTAQLQKFIGTHGRDTTLFPPSDTFNKMQ
jgi:hypothetical protein